MVSLKVLGWAGARSIGPIAREKSGTLLKHSRSKAQPGFRIRSAGVRVGRVWSTQSLFLVELLQILNQMRIDFFFVVSSGGS